MAARALGVVIVISVARMPPASRASNIGSTSVKSCARTTAMTPGQLSISRTSDLERVTHGIADPAGNKTQAGTARAGAAGIGTEASVIAPMMIVRKNTPVRELKEIQPRCYN